MSLQHGLIITTKIYTKLKEYMINKDSNRLIYHFDFSNRKVEVTPNLFWWLVSRVACVAR